MPAPPRKRRWPWILGIALALLAIAALWVNHQLEPTRLARTVLSALGESQGLEITFEGLPDYALRPEPRLVLPNVVARQPGAAAPLLTAARAEVSLPWDTIWGGDDTVVITRVELDRPALDLAALADWRASRPEAPFQLPTLTRGVRASNGRIVGDGWRVETLDLAFAELIPAQALEVDAEGRFERETLTVEFDASLLMRHAGLASTFELESSGQVRQDELDVPWSVESTGNFDFSAPASEGGTASKRIELSMLDFESQSPLPTFEASGNADLGQPTTFALQGTMPEWPQDWPVLPEPESRIAQPLKFSLAYEGATDLSDPVSLKLARGETRLDATLVVAQVQAWLADEARTPVPPVRGSFSAPSLVIEGFTLEDVQAQIVEPAPASEE